MAKKFTTSPLQADTPVTFVESPETKKVLVKPTKTVGIVYIPDNTVERYEGPFMTNVGEFTYSNTDPLVSVRKDQNYFIVYLKSKRVVYELAVNRQRIDRKKRVNQEVYSEIKSVSRDVYPEKKYPTAKDLPFDQIFFPRIFAKNILYDTSEVAEVTSVTNSTSYVFGRMNWQIGGLREQARMNNEKELLKLERVFPGISERIPPLQLHRETVLKEQSAVARITKNPMYTQVDQPTIDSPVEDVVTAPIQSPKSGPVTPPSPGNTTTVSKGSGGGY